MSDEIETLLGWAMLAIGTALLAWAALARGGGNAITAGGVFVLLGAYGLGQASRKK